MDDYGFRFDFLRIVISLMVSLFFTVFVYGAFPLVFVKICKNPITKKKLGILFWGFNFVVMFAVKILVFWVGKEEIFSVVPYLFWTGVFLKYGLKKIEDRGLRIDSDSEKERERAKYFKELETKTDDYDEDILKTEDVLEKVLKFQAVETIRTLKYNEINQPNNESAEDFGIVSDKPIFTLAVKSVEGEIAYLDKLRTVDGEKIKYRRRGSTIVESIGGVIDIYDTYLLSGDLYKTIYINMYGAKESLRAPVGFVFVGDEVQSQPVIEEEKKIKVRYCSKCGSEIDNQTKICGGCGKQYFRGIRLNKRSVINVVVSVMLAVSLIFNIILSVEKKRSDEQIASVTREVVELKNYNKKLESQNKDLEYVVDFVEQYIVFVVDDGTDLYHKFNCSIFQEGDSFWAYNIEAAESRGYEKCAKCY